MAPNTFSLANISPKAQTLRDRQALGDSRLFLNTLRNMYLEVRIRVRFGNRISSAFLAEAGVEQGDNISPLLFGIFVDQLEKFFTELVS